MSKRTEYPNPQFERKNYVCLNGEWSFETDKQKTGFTRGLLERELSGKIEVPFCPESELSGVKHTDFINACWYKKKFVLSQNDFDGLIHLKFGAADYSARVYINGREVGRHSGGYTPFGFDITEYAGVGENEITVYVEDDITANVPSGKQSPKSESFGCFYTRVTGIWQTVWLEFTPQSYIKSVRYFSDVKAGAVTIEAVTVGAGTLRTRITYKGKTVGEYQTDIAYKAVFTVPLSQTHLWEVGKGRLYDAEFTFGGDKVYSYFGLREVGFDGLRFVINGKSVFQRLVLDQGYYPKGIYTAESGSEFIRDIELAGRLGFNGSRLHQKVFEPRFLYECDKAGWLVWGETASWGVRYCDLEGAGNFMNEWREAVERDFNHPSIVTWCPLNEMWEDLNDKNKTRDIRFSEAVYDFTKTLDPTRPCVDVSGGYHGKRTDLADFHCYLRYDGLKAHIDDLSLGYMTEKKAYLRGETARYEGQPVNVSEYGGIAFGKNADKTEVCACVRETTAWGYETETDDYALAASFVRLTELIMNCGKLSGCCYTQLYDVEQECNGLYTYDRASKLSAAAEDKIRDCLSRLAAIEKDSQVIIEQTAAERERNGLYAYDRKLKFGSAAAEAIKGCNGKTAAIE